MLIFVNMEKYDVIVVGGGIVGVSTAWQLRMRYPGCRILLLEKEPEVGLHQTGRNSGVVHAGVYYEPGSMKSIFCREGNRATYEFCSRHRVPVQRCGKMLVATDSLEYQRMEALYQRILKNRIRVERLDRGDIQTREPNISGIAALFVPDTGIVDYGRITRKMAELFMQSGGVIKCRHPLFSLRESKDQVTVSAGGHRFVSRYLIACAGLYADRLVKLLGIRPEFQIIPFRGEYYQLSPSKRNIIHHLIYPIPNPNLPFLGIHLTRMIHGTVTAGPNAVMALKREGYQKTQINLYDLFEMMRFKGFWNVIRQHLGAGVLELKNSLFKSAYLKAVQKYCPQLRGNDLRPYPAGVRAQAVDKNGTLIHDFLFVNTRRTIHVCNAPSPAATSAIPIGRHIVEKTAELFED
ncbi:MAG: L-2-hydroxyglutarate oxidase [Deltaproteobacteria bacterium]